MFRSAIFYVSVLVLSACAVGKNTDITNNNAQDEAPASVIVTFTIAPKTTGAWNTKNNPFIVQAGQTVRIVNGDTAGNPHSLQTDGVPCSSSSNIPVGSHYDCGPIPNTYTSAADPINDGANAANTNATFMIVVE